MIYSQELLQKLKLVMLVQSGIVIFALCTFLYYILFFDEYPESNYIIFTILNAIIIGVSIFMWHRGRYLVKQEKTRVYNDLKKVQDDIDSGKWDNLLGNERR